MLNRSVIFILLLAGASAPDGAQTLVNLQTQTRNADFSGFTFTRTVSVGTAEPSTCQVGQLFFDSVAAAGSNLYACTATNVWTPVGGSGTVQSVSWAGLPNWLNGTVSNGTTTPSLALSMAGGQTSHLVLGTGAASSFGPISLSSADLPALITSTTTGNAATATALAATPTACSAGQYATGITASGNANCSEVAYSQVSGTPSLYNQTIQVNGTNQPAAPTLNLAAGSDVTLTGNTSSGVTTVVINSSAGVSGPTLSTNYALPYWNGTAGNLLGSSGIVTDAGADLITTGAISASSVSAIGSGAGTLSVSQGQAQSSFGQNSVSIYAPASVPSAYQWVLPTADAVGAIMSDGNGNPGHLSIAPVMTQVAPPSAMGQSCTSNTYAIDSNAYLYYCLPAGTWVRTQMTPY